MTEYVTTPAFKIAVLKLLLQLLQWRLETAHNKKLKNKGHMVQEAFLKNN